jgi:eukaryotic-like serine/threonine-protein kinase
MADPGTLIGQTVSRYRILEEVGQGGMGVVFRARDEQLERDVAVKILPLRMFPDQRARNRFHREARVLAKLNHPNIAMAFDYGEQDGIHCLVTEFVGGMTIDAKLANGPLTEKTVIQLGIQLAKGLAAAHHEHIIVWPFWGVLGRSIWSATQHSNGLRTLR